MLWNDSVRVWKWLGDGLFMGGHFGVLVPHFFTARVLIMYIKYGFKHFDWKNDLRLKPAAAPVKKRKISGMNARNAILQILHCTFVREGESHFVLVSHCNKVYSTSVASSLVHSCERVKTKEAFFTSKGATNERASGLRSTDEEKNEFWT